jgi:hypothetical protein
MSMRKRLYSHVTRYYEVVRDPVNGKQKVMSPVLNVQCGEHSGWVFSPDFVLNKDALNNTNARSVQDIQFDHIEKMEDSLLCDKDKRLHGYNEYLYAMSRTGVA